MNKNEKMGESEPKSLSFLWTYSIAKFENNSYNVLNETPQDEIGGD